MCFSSPTIPGIPQHGKVLEFFPQEKCCQVEWSKASYDQVDWSQASQSFPYFVKLLKLKEYVTDTLLGFIINTAAAESVVSTNSS